MGGITRVGARQCPGRALSVPDQNRLALIVSERRYATRYLTNPRRGHTRVESSHMTRISVVTSSGPRFS